MVFDSSFYESNRRFLKHLWKRHPAFSVYECSFVWHKCTGRGCGRKNSQTFWERKLTRLLEKAAKDTSAHGSVIYYTSVLPTAPYSSISGNLPTALRVQACSGDYLGSSKNSHFRKVTSRLYFMSYRYSDLEYQILRFSREAHTT